MAADLGDPLEEPAAAIYPSGSVSGGSNFGTPFPFCMYQGPAAGPQSTRLHGTRLTDKERPPRARRGKWRPHSRLCNSEADYNRKQLPQMPVPGCASSVAAFLFGCVLFPPFRRGSPQKTTFSALLPPRTALAALCDADTAGNNESSECEVSACRPERISSIKPPTPAKSGRVSPAPWQDRGSHFGC